MTRDRKKNTEHVARNSFREKFYALACIQSPITEGNSNDISDDDDDDDDDDSDRGVRKKGTKEIKEKRISVKSGARATKTRTAATFLPTTTTTTITTTTTTITSTIVFSHRQWSPFPAACPLLIALAQQTFMGIRIVSRVTKKSIDRVDHYNDNDDNGDDEVMMTVIQENA
ncbi:hypothetical protein M0804_007000 [Polistes exclamans]|nr:hypothetical protein M0804_007000 [Polistes exclamans]